MALPKGLMGRMLWGRIKEKTKRGLLNAIPNRAYYSMFRRQRRDIVMLASQLGLRKRRVGQHFKELLKQGTRRAELGEAMIRDLNEMLELRELTKVEPAKFNTFMERNPIQAALEEMREQFQGMQQMEVQAREKARV